MSDQLHPTHLEWTGRTGLARHDGVQMQLHRSPGVFAEVHYTPGIQAEVRDRPGDPRRDMTAFEVKAAQSYLANLAARCREVVGQQAPVQPQEAAA